MQTESQSAYGTTAPAAGALGAGPSPATQRSTLDAMAPGQLRTIKRNGTVVSYDESKIAVAITTGGCYAVALGNAPFTERERSSKPC